MCDFPFRSAVDGNHEVGYPVGRGEGSDARQIVSKLFSRPRFIGNTCYRAPQPLFLKTIMQTEVDSLSYQDI